MLRLVAEHAQMWHAFGDVETIAHKGAVLDEWCAQASGATPARSIRSTTLRDDVTPRARARVRRAAGVDELVVASHGPGLRPRAAAQARGAPRTSLTRG